jgi:transcriptional regulator with XRE-family HTH domain
MRATMGSRIAGRRVEQRWTQEELAERAGISSKYLSRVECDNANPSVDVLSRIAVALETTMDILNRGAP